MPTEAWSRKRERQYRHVKESEQKQGRSKADAEEIAARTVNKERTRKGESKTAGKASTQDISSGRRGRLRSHSGPGGRTMKQLYEEARRRDIKGRSSMKKAVLENAVDAK